MTETVLALIVLPFCIGMLALIFWPRKGGV